MSVSVKALHTSQFQVKDQQTLNSLAFTCIRLDTVTALVNWCGQITMSGSERKTNAYTIIFSYITRQAIILITFFIFSLEPYPTACINHFCFSQASFGHPM